MRSIPRLSLLFVLLFVCPAHAEDEPYLRDIRQLTREPDFRKAGEAYFDPAGKRILFQAVAPTHPYYQIYVMNADGSGVRMVSTGKGKTTCAYFLPGQPQRFLYASTHLDPATHVFHPPKDPRRRYRWDYDGSFDLFVGSLEDGSVVARLTSEEGYDAEGSVSHDGKTICYTVRRGDAPDQIWLMDADGKNRRPLVASPRMACGGPFFSPDDRWVLYRAIETGAHEMHVYLTSVDGRQTRRLTTLPRINWAPFFHPKGEVVVYCANAPDDRSNFDLYLVKADGSGREVQLTTHHAFDGLPTFDPSGERLLWTSKRGGKDSQVFLASFTMPPDDAFRRPRAPARSGGHGGPPASRPASRPAGQDGGHGHAPAERHPGSVGPPSGRVEPRPGIVVKRPIPALERIVGEEMMVDLRWLADDARQGRRAGTPGARAAAEYIARRFAELGLKGAGPEGSYFHEFEFTAGGKIEDLSLEVLGEGGASLSRGESLEGLVYSRSGSATGEVVFVGYGIRAEDHHYDDLAGVELGGRIALVLTGAPRADKGGAFGNDHPTVYEDLRYKIAACRDAGASAVLLVRSRGEGWLSLSNGDPGIPVAQLSREAAQVYLGLDVAAAVRAIEERGAPASRPLGRRARLRVQVTRKRVKSRNVLARLPGHGNPHEVILIGAHYDHLGLGGDGSLAPNQRAIHNGADDNASGVAALLAIAKAFRANPPQRTIVFAAFSAEEEGLIGSQRYVETFHTERIVAMLNLDMVGRRGVDPLLVGGYGTAKEWPDLLQAVVDYTGDEVQVQRDGFGPSDHASFYAAGVPVLFLWTGTHADYHKPSDDADLIDEEGLQAVARFAFLLARGIDAMPRRPTYVKLPRRARPRSVATGQRRASFGSIPNYASEGIEGVLLDGAREGSPAAEAGIRKGDVLVEFNGRKIVTIHDFVNALRLAKPGQRVKVIVLREGERVALEATLR
ncbi:MAG: M20/M25/M40 family metallo-hydrolase [Planctomycetota bacterium]|nr:MAG: M20/M25/M40 family metallo-hydrolase [Planctomycetota bacterium]